MRKTLALMLAMVLATGCSTTQSSLATTPDPPPGLVVTAVRTHDGEEFRFEPPAVVGEDGSVRGSALVEPAGEDGTRTRVIMLAASEIAAYEYTEVEKSTDMDGTMVWVGVVAVVVALLVFNSQVSEPFQCCDVPDVP